MTEDRGTTGIVESASATTNPDNANSGPAAYIIAAAAVLVIAVSTFGMTSCMAGIAGAAVSAGGRSGSRETMTRYFDDDYDDYFEDYFDEYFDEFEPYSLN